jgi:hypothetical protein
MGPSQRLNGSEPESWRERYTPLNDAEVPAGAGHAWSVAPRRMHTRAMPAICAKLDRMAMAAGDTSLASGILTKAIRETCCRPCRALPARRARACEATHTQPPGLTQAGSNLETLWR